MEGFSFVGATQAAAEGKDSVAIGQGQGFQKTFQFFETIADFRRIRFVDSQ